MFARRLETLMDHRGDTGTILPNTTANRYVIGLWTPPATEGSDSGQDYEVLSGVVVGWIAYKEYRRAFPITLEGTGVAKNEIRYSYGEDETEARRNAAIDLEAWHRNA